MIRERGGGAAFGRLLVALSLVAGLVAFVGEDALGAFIGRASSVGDVRSRVTSPLLSPYLLLPDAGLLGFGIGSTHQTAAALAPNLPPYSWLRGLIVETESGRILLEVGAIGFLMVYFVRIAFTIYALQQVMTLRTRFHRAMATAAFLMFVASLPTGVIFDVTSDVYYWFFAGLLMLSVRLDREAVAAAAARKREQARAAAMASLTPTGPIPIPPLPRAQERHDGAGDSPRPAALPPGGPGPGEGGDARRVLGGHPRGRLPARYAPVPLDPARTAWFPWTPALRRIGSPAPTSPPAACSTAGRPGGWGRREPRPSPPRSSPARSRPWRPSGKRKRRGMLTLLDAPSIHHAAQDRLHGTHGFGGPAPPDRGGQGRGDRAGGPHPDRLRAGARDLPGGRGAAGEGARRPPGGGPGRVLAGSRREEPAR